MLARATSATTFVREPPAMRPTLTVTPRAQVLQRGDGDDLVRELVNRRSRPSRIDAGVRRHAVDGQLELAAALARRLDARRPAATAPAPAPRRSRRPRLDGRARRLAADSSSVVQSMTIRCGARPLELESARSASIAMAMPAFMSNTPDRGGGRPSLAKRHALELADRPDRVEVTEQEHSRRRAARTRRECDRRAALARQPRDARRQSPRGATPVRRRSDRRPPCPSRRLERDEASMVSSSQSRSCLGSNRGGSVSEHARASRQSYKTRDATRRCVRPCSRSASPLCAAQRAGRRSRFPSRGRQKPGRKRRRHPRTPASPRRPAALRPTPAPTEAMLGVPIYPRRSSSRPTTPAAASAIYLFGTDDAVRADRRRTTGRR